MPQFESSHWTDTRCRQTTNNLQTVQIQFYFNHPQINAIQWYWLRLTAIVEHVIYNNNPLLIIKNVNKFFSFSSIPKYSNLQKRSWYAIINSTASCYCLQKNISLNLTIAHRKTPHKTVKKYILITQTQIRLDCPQPYACSIHTHVWKWIGIKIPNFFYSVNDGLKMK